MCDYCSSANDWMFEPFPVGQMKRLICNTFHRRYWEPEPARGLRYQAEGRDSGRLSCPRCERSWIPCSQEKDMRHDQADRLIKALERRNKLADPKKEFRPDQTVLFYGFWICVAIGVIGAVFH
jgi:hypothetical protein